MAAVLAKPPYARRTTVRKEMGQDIAGACGQLALKNNHPERASAAEDIEDVAGTGTRDGAKAGARARSTSRLGVGATAKVPGGASRRRGRAERAAAKADAHAAKADAHAAANPDVVADAIATGTGSMTGTSRRGVSAETTVRALNVVAFAACTVLFLASAWEISHPRGRGGRALAERAVYSL